MSDITLDDCGGCEGLRTQTPAEIKNAPGLPAISYRVGTYNQFKQSMLVQLSAAADLPALMNLNTRSNDDFSIALLDSWAMACDVLTFYQERIANESYQRTATERASLLQLASSVSYGLQPGVAAETYLAFTLDDSPGSPGQAIIDMGVKVQSLPNPGEKPQVFETIEAIVAHSAWNAIQPSKTQPQILSTTMPSIVFKGTATNLRPGDMLLIVAPNADAKKPANKAIRRVKRVTVDNVAQQTTAYLEDTILTDTLVSGDGTGRQEQQLLPHPPTTPMPPAPPDSPPPPVLVGSSNGARARAVQPSYTMHQALSNTTVDTVVRNRIWDARDLNAFATVQGWPVKDVLTTTTTTVTAAEDGTGVFVLGTRTLLFGYNAPDWKAMPEPVRTTYFNAYKHAAPHDTRSITDFTDWPFLPPTPSIIIAGATPSEPEGVLDLDRLAPQLLHNNWVVITWHDNSITIAPIDSTTEVGVVNYTLSGRVTRLKLQTTEKATPASMDDIRQATFYGQSDKLTLAELPTDKLVQNKTIEVVGFYDGLLPGMTLMVAGELSDLAGVQASEVVTLANAAFDTSYPGGRTTLTLVDNLAHAYKAATVTIYGNIARATQGETIQNEILGDGDTSQPYQHFTLLQAPLTYIHNETPRGITSTLKVYVNEIEWQEVPTLLGHGPRDRVFTTLTDNDGKTTIQFGDGNTGALLPNGQENVRATYRKGSGSQGHVNAGQLTQLMTRPLGVKGVTNLQAPTGAEDSESIDDARNNAALTALTLGRIVSIQDYENLARSFVGVAKVQATLVSTSRVSGVFVTLAGIAGKEIADNDPLYRRVFFALKNASDPSIPIKLQSYRKALFRLAASIKVEADFGVSDVLATVQQTMRSHFAFETRSFGQGVALQEVINVIQDVPGVVTANVTRLYRLGDTLSLNTQLNAALPTVGPDGKVLPAELLVADTVTFDALEVIP